MMNQEKTEKRKAELKAEAEKLMEKIKLLKTELDKVIEEIEINVHKLRKLDGTACTAAKPCAIVALTTNLTGSKANTAWFDVTGQEAERTFFLVHSIKKLSNVEMKFIKEDGTPLKMNAEKMGIKFALKIHAIGFGAPNPPSKQQKKKSTGCCNIISHLKKWFNN